jgi:hypothetical protein
MLDLKPPSPNVRQSRPAYLTSDLNSIDFLMGWNGEGAEVQY